MRSAPPEPVGVDVDSVIAPFIEAFDRRCTALEERFEAVFREEVRKAFTAQTRAIVFSMVGVVTALAGIALALARFAPGS